VSHCLEKRPEQRFHSAHDLAFHLKALEAGTGTSAAVPARARPTGRLRFDSGRPGPGPFPDGKWASRA
jgi:hypothetical protein